MTDYSGGASFDFEVERYKKDGILYPHSFIEDKDELEYEHVTIILLVEGSSYFQSGKFSGPPERSYPEEGNTEIISVIGLDGKSWEEDLTDDEKEKIITMIEDNLQDEEDYDEEDYDEDDDIDTW